MSKQIRIPNKILCESFLIGVLYLVGTLSLYEDIIRHGRPYVYPTILMVQLFIIKSWMRIPSNNTLYYFLFIKPYNDKLLKVCRLTQIPNRRTIDRRFQVLPISDIIGTIGNLFVSEKLVDDTSASVDGSMLQAKGPDVSTANIHDGTMYCGIIEPLAGLVENILCDPAYDDKSLYQFSNKKHLRMITPIKQYPRTPPERIKLVEFYNSVIGQKLYRDRKISIEPLFEILKSTFGIGVLPVKGFDNVKSFVLICVLVYQLAVYYNCVIGNGNPRVVRRMLCC